MKRVLILNAGATEENLIKNMKKLNCYVITTGNRPYLKGHKLADKYVYADFSDMEAILQIAKDEKIDAICPCCNDTSVKTAAYVAEKLGLPGHDSYKTACIIANKHEFKEFAMKAGCINTPHAVDFDNADSALKWAKECDHYPVIVKPVDLDSGKGVTRADNYTDLKEAIIKALDLSISGKIVVEPFIEGTQHGFCTFLVNKKVMVAASNDEDSFINPYRVEVDRFPASCYDDVRAQLIEQIEYMADKLDLSDGIFHLQFIYCNGKAYIIECMRRILGNLYTMLATIHNDGFDWDYWYVRAICGFGCEGVPHKLGGSGFVGYRSLLAEKAGKIESIYISEDIKKYIFREQLLLEKGAPVTRPYFEPVYLIFMEFKDRKEMKEILIDRYKDIYVEIAADQ